MIAALLADLRGRGVVVSSVAGELHYRAPRGALTDELRDQVRTHKLEIVAALVAEPDPPIAIPSPNYCPRCLNRGLTSTGREGQNVYPPGHRAFHCETDDTHVWLIYADGRVES